MFSFYEGGLGLLHVGPPQVPSHVGPPAAGSQNNALLAVALEEFSRQLADDNPAEKVRDPIISESSKGRYWNNGMPPPPQPFTPVAQPGEDVLQRYDPTIRKQLVLEQLFRNVSVASRPSTSAATGYAQGDLAVQGVAPAVRAFRIECPTPPMFVVERKSVAGANQRKKSPDRRRTEQLAELVLQADAAPSFLLAVAGAAPTTHPWTIELLDTAATLMSIVLHTIKHTLRIARPAAGDASIVPLLHTPSHYSFPSGHATYAYCAAELLAALTNASPGASSAKLRTKLLRAATLIADNRVVAGLHYPADSDAGEAVGRSIAHWIVGQGGAGWVNAKIFNPSYAVDASKGEASLSFTETPNVALPDTPRWRWLMHRAWQEWQY